jgi:hypothetical protein
VGWCNLNPVRASIDSAWFQRLKLRYEEPLSNLAFKFNVRRCSKWANIQSIYMKTNESVAGAYTRSRVHVRAQLEHIRDTFMGQVGLRGAQRQLKLSCLHSFTLELNLSTFGTQSWVKLGYAGHKDGSS